MSKVFQNYSRALCSAILDDPTLANGSQNAILEKTRVELNSFINIIESHAPLKNALASPIVSNKDKEKVILQLSEQLHISPMLKNMFRKMAQKNRFIECENFLKCFDEVRADLNHKLVGTIVSATPLNENEVNEITALFEKKLSKKINFELKTDVQLLGGLKVTVGGVTYDRSIQSQLNRLKESVLEYLK